MPPIGTPMALRQITSNQENPMKNAKKAALTLSRETLMRLDDRALRGVIGGADQGGGDTSCVSIFACNCCTRNGTNTNTNTNTGG